MDRMANPLWKRLCSSLRDELTEVRIFVPAAFHAPLGAADCQRGRRDAAAAREETTRKTNQPGRDDPAAERATPPPLALGRRRRGEPREHGRDDPVAARPGERERLVESGVELARERLTQHAARPEEARPHGRLWDVEQVRGLFYRELLERAQHEHRTERVGQRVDPTLDE